jgi:hypothetical protein
VNARGVARTLALGRVAIGAGLLVAPKLGRRWLGEVADSEGGQVAIRTLGIRDFLLGAVTLHTLAHPEVAPRWVAACAVADVVDCAATLAARDALPSRGAPTAVLAGGSAAAGFAAAAALRRG